MSTARAYYNEFDPKAAAWLRELIKGGHIAPGDVDERSIVDILPSDLNGYTQCHFFAGIGGWSYALRLAGWPDERHVWTGSCPCQPFSAAGKGGGFADERHLWPAFFHLIEECEPAIIFGEQVASKDGLAWLDLVQADLEGAGYASGAADLCAAGVGAPHIRQRLYWVAHVYSIRRKMALQHIRGCRPQNSERQTSESGMCGVFSGAADSAGIGRQQWRSESSERSLVNNSLMGDTDNEGSQRRDERRNERRNVACQRGTWPAGVAIDWVACRDEKFRPIESGSFPLAYGVPSRVGLLRGYGNAIVPQVAATFIEAYLDTLSRLR